MLEIVILTVIVVGLYRKRGERWEWSRTRLRRAFGSLADEGERMLEGTHRSFPQLLAQCIEDVRGLLADLTRMLDPSLRRRLQDRTRILLRASGTRRNHGLETVPANGAPTGRAAAPGSPVARLQRRYLDGSISLEEYVEQAGRIGRDGVGA